ncbi:GyrI-like domain-containing protein [Arthrobacter gandavensis]|uniref:GyrI-like domain-containing protein n=1 Tax=Arthrobacter gandavensis TaxID=169960 RepID=UPI00188FFE32|nr:GyrI-like domain-containing protein [Arthrobacter gandavensis]MBF4992694.1 GyrI-like domain-containing protein [Arthrobacter gandavensis]
MTDIELTERSEQATAGVREQVPMGEMAEFFARAFQQTIAALREQGVQPAGPPFGKYYGRPGATVDVEAGFPVLSEVTPDGNVRPGHLPGGRILEATHTGPFDTMERTYAQLDRYAGENGLTPGEVMWESYLTDPEREPDTSKWQTQVCWQVSE